MNSKFDPYSFDYKTYMLETYNLNEMPLRMDDHKFVLDDTILNHREGIRVEKSATKLEDVMAGNQKYRLFREIEDENVTFYLLDETKPFIAAEYSYAIIDHPIKGIENTAIWNHKWHKGLARYFFEHYILNQFDVIISDKVLTNKGYKFFKDQVEQVNHKTHRAYVVDFTNGKVLQNIETTEDMDKYFGSQSSKFRFVIERIK